jgi:hypothetical protein
MAGHLGERLPGRRFHGTLGCAALSVLRWRYITGRSDDNGASPSNSQEFQARAKAMAGPRDGHCGADRRHAVRTDGRY